MVMEKVSPGTGRHCVQESPGKGGFQKNLWDLWLLCDQVKNKSAPVTKPCQSCPEPCPVCGTHGTGGAAAWMLLHKEELG